MSSNQVFDENYNALTVVRGGKNIDTATPDDFVFHSGFAYHGVPIGLEGYIEYTSPSVFHTGETIVKEINHNLGYVPDYHVFIEELEDSGAFAHLPYGYIATGVSFTAKADTEKLYIIFENTGDDIVGLWTDRDYGFRYQIFNTGIIPRSS